jgi:hypothetical protein
MQRLGREAMHATPPVQQLCVGTVTKKGSKLKTNWQQKLCVRWHCNKEGLKVKDQLAAKTLSPVLQYTECMAG